MSQNLEHEQKTGFNQEQLLVLSGLRITINPSAWRFWRESLPGELNNVDVAVASVNFNENGQPIAVGVLSSELFRTIVEHGDPSSTSAQIIAVDPDRIVLFTPDGKDRWPAIRQI